jgi:hypothetical protein
MAQHRYVDTFRNWVRLNENNEDETEVIERIIDITRNFVDAVQRGPLETSDLMIWFHGMLELYDNSDLKGLIFKMMAPVWRKYFKQIYPLLSVNNSVLTQSDIQLVKRYKSLSNDEVTTHKGNRDFLKSLGMEDNEKTAEAIFKENGLIF